MICFAYFKEWKTSSYFHLKLAEIDKSDPHPHKVFSRNQRINWQRSSLSSVKLFLFFLFWKVYLCWCSFFSYSVLDYNYNNIQLYILKNESDLNADLMIFSAISEILRDNWFDGFEVSDLRVLIILTWILLRILI